MNATPPLSVVMPCHGPVPFLAEAMAPLLAQMDTSDELVLVDNNVAASVDLRVHTDDVRVRVVDARGRGSAGLARNVGAAAARHDLLLFCDADDRAGEGYVAAMRAQLADHPVVGAAESYRLLNDGEAARQPDSPALWYWREDPGWPFVGSCALGMQRAAFSTVGGFDVAIPALEDIDLGLRLTLAGIPHAAADGCVMHIRHRGDRAAEHRRQISHGRASVWLEARYASHGLPRESRARNAAGWVKHLGALLVVTGEARDGHLAVLGWKRGRLLGAMDLRRKGPAPSLDLCHTAQPW